MLSAKQFFTNNRITGQQVPRKRTTSHAGGFFAEHPRLSNSPSKSKPFTLIETQQLNTSLHVISNKSNTKIQEILNEKIEISYNVPAKQASKIELSRIIYDDANSIVFQDDPGPKTTGQNKFQIGSNGQKAFIESAHLASCDMNDHSQHSEFEIQKSQHQLLNSKNNKYSFCSKNKLIKLANKFQKKKVGATQGLKNIKDILSHRHNTAHLNYGKMGRVSSQENLNIVSGKVIIDHKPVMTANTPANYNQIKNSNVFEFKDLCNKQLQTMNKSAKKKKNGLEINKNNPIIKTYEIKYEKYNNQDLAKLEKFYSKKNDKCKNHEESLIKSSIKLNDTKKNCANNQIENLDSPFCNQQSIESEKVKIKDPAPQKCGNNVDKKQDVQDSSSTLSRENDDNTTIKQANNPDQTTNHHHEYDLNNVHKIINFLGKDEKLMAKKANIRKKLKDLKNYDVQHTFANKSNENGSRARPTSSSDVTAFIKGTIIADYILGKIIGQGSYAIVQVAVEKSLGRKVAIKTYEKLKLLDPHKMKNVKREIENLKVLNHPYVIRLLNDIHTIKHIHLVTEYIGSNNLSNYIESLGKKNVNL